MRPASLLRTAFLSALIPIALFCAPPPADASAASKASKLFDDAKRNLKAAPNKKATGHLEEGEGSLRYLEVPPGSAEDMGTLNGIEELANGRIVRFYMKLPGSDLAGRKSLTNKTASIKSHDANNPGTNITSRNKSELHPFDVNLKQRFDIGTVNGIQVRTQNFYQFQPLTASRDPLPSEDIWGYVERNGDSLDVRIGRPFAPIESKNVSASIKLDPNQGEVVGLDMDHRGSSVTVYRTADGIDFYRDIHYLGENYSRPPGRSLEIIAPVESTVTRKLTAKEVEKLRFLDVKSEEVEMVAEVTAEGSSKVPAVKRSNERSNERRKGRPTGR